MASTSHRARWDVFISFRGSDTRHSFTDHLYGALQSNGVRTFMDDPELRSGEVIADALLQAIEESKTYIVVLSKNYASSRWCLDELVAILSCYKRMNRCVIPVFYKIDPSVVRHQTGRFKEAFERHENRVDMDRLGKWRSTLTTVADLSGYSVPKNMAKEKKETDR
nr:PREDICTED: toll/interleukin-1 receptor-like protein [Daucus carota subsp. sativus]